MTATQFFSVLVRLAGFIVLIWGLRSQTSYIQGFVTSSAPPAPWDILSITVVVMSVVASIVMIAFPTIVAKRFLPFSGDTQLGSPWTAGELETVLVSSIGLWLLSQSLLDAAYWITFVHDYRTIGEKAVSPLPLQSDHVGQIVATSLEIIVGLVLLFQAPAIARLLQRLRKL